MVEYCIRQYYANGVPYESYVSNNIEDVKKHIDILVDFYHSQPKRRKPYFVDNDYYNNIFNGFCTGTYYCIMKREVSDWEKYSEK